MIHALAGLAMLFAADPGPLKPGDFSRTLRVDGNERAYLVHVPPQYDPDKPMPVVLAFHGGGANASTMVVFSGLNEKADQAGFIVAYPEGSGRLEKMLTFNAGNCCGLAAARTIDDVAFTRHLLGDLEGVANVDRRLDDRQRVPKNSDDDTSSRSGGRRHDRHATALRRGPGWRGGRARRRRGRWAHVARQGATAAFPRRVNAGHLGQRHDVGVLRASPHEVTRVS